MDRRAESRASLCGRQRERNKWREEWREEWKREKRDGKKTDGKKRDAMHVCMSEHVSVSVCERDRMVGVRVKVYEPTNS